MPAAGAAAGAAAAVESWACVGTDTTAAGIAAAGVEAAIADAAGTDCADAAHAAAVAAAAAGADCTLSAGHFAVADALREEHCSCQGQLGSDQEQAQKLAVARMLSRLSGAHLEQLHRKANQGMDPASKHNKVQQGLLHAFRVAIQSPTYCNSLICTAGVISFAQASTVVLALAGQECRR